MENIKDKKEEYKLLVESEFSGCRKQPAPSGSERMQASTWSLKGRCLMLLSVLTQGTHLSPRHFVLRVGSQLCAVALFLLSLNLLLPPWSFQVAMLLFLKLGDTQGKWNGSFYLTLVCVFNHKACPHYLLFLKLKKSLILSFLYPSDSPLDYLLSYGTFSFLFVDHKWANYFKCNPSISEHQKDHLLFYYLFLDIINECDFKSGQLFGYHILLLSHVTYISLNTLSLATIPFPVSSCSIRWFCSN